MIQKQVKISIVLAISLFLASCQSSFYTEQLQQQYNAANTGDIYQSDYDILDKGPEAGGTLNLFSTFPDTFNPLLTKNIYVADFMSFVYEGLTKLNEKQQAVPYLSDYWSVSEDGLVWNFHIRDGVKWHDGQDFTAYDVEFTINSLMNPGIDSVYKPLIKNIITCAAVDSSNVKLVLKKKNSFTPEMMTFPVLQKKQFENNDFITASKDFAPVGTGPYKFSSYKEGKQVVLKADKNWWYLNVEGSEAKNGLYLETINVNLYKKQNDIMEAFQAGDADVFGIDSSDFSKFSGRTDIIIKKYTSRDFEFLSLNMSNPVLSDEYARKAISTAINRDELIADILPGVAVAADLPVIPGSWIDTEGNESSLTFSGEKPDPRAILEEGGWKESKDGYYKQIDGLRRYLKVELIVNSNNTIRVSVAQKICSQLEQSGIQATCTQVTWDELKSRVNNSKYDIAFLGCRVPQLPDISYLYSDSYLSGAIPSGIDAARNISGYKNVQVDTYINLIFAENNPERQKAIFKSLKTQVLNDTPYIGLYFLRNAMVYSKNLRGQLNPDTWNRYKDIYHWYKPVSQ